MTFALSKIRPPHPPANHVERGAVAARLDEALRSGGVVLACAPAGYGKTSLLAKAVSRLPAGFALAWVASDPGDGLADLLECLLAALERYDPPWRTAPEALVKRAGTGADEERAVAAEVLNTLEAIDAPHGVIVFDDLHRVEDPAAFRFLDRLAERLGPRWTLVLSSRADPPVALARLRAAGTLAEFRQLELQFARDEARQLVTRAGFDAAIADRLFERTQGWPAGLRIAMGSVPGSAGNWPDAIERALRSGERPLFEFLVTEVLDQLDPGLADFLERVSVLADLEAGRCAAVSGHADAVSRLDEVERLGLFVTALDAPVRTLRLHDLFREALQRRLAQRDPALLRAMRREAATTEPDPNRRIALLLEAGDGEEAARLAMAHLPTVIVTAGPGGPAQLLARFPSPLRDASPALHFVRGLIAWVHWDFPGSLEHFTRAEAGFAAAGDARDELHTRPYRATLAIATGRIAEAERALASMDGLDLPRATRIVLLNARAWLAIDTGRLASVAGFVDGMLDLLVAEGRLDLWYHTSTPIRMPGLPGIARTLERHAALQLAAAGDEPALLRALALLVQSWCSLWRGDLRECLALRERAREEADWSGSTGAVRNHLLTLTAFSSVVAGDVPGALAAAEARLREPVAGVAPRVRYVLAIFGARIAAAAGETRLLRERLGAAQATAAELERAGLAPLRAPEKPMEGQLAWLEGRRDEAIVRWRGALEDEEALDFYGQAAETRVRLASALAERGDRREAIDVLEPFFNRLADNGGPGGALFAASALARLASAPWAGVLDPARRAQLEGWANLARAIPPPDEREGLTARERQVLERIAAGDSNKAIARALDLSLHTVKRHVANILGKLGVQTRGQAAAWLAARAD